MSASMMFRHPKFSSLMWTQFFGALNDNVLKNALVVMLAFKGITLWGLRSETLVTLATLIFILPFFLFSAMAGMVADKFEKSALIRIIKTAEILIMVLAGLGFLYGMPTLLFFALFLMGIHSAFFGPLKYSTLPALLSPEELTSGNAYVEVGTFIAILIGTISGGVLISAPGGELWLTLFLILNAVAGLWFGRRVPATPIGDASLTIALNPVPQTLGTLRAVRGNRAVHNSILGISWFWFLGAVILSLLPGITKHLLNANQHVVTLFLAVFTIGIAAGAVLCEKLSFERVEIGLVPVGSIGITLFLLDFAITLNSWDAPMSTLEARSFLQQPGALRMLFDLIGIAISGGLFTVPLYTLIQQRSSPENRSRVIGANNILNALFMVVGSALLMALQQYGVSVPKILVLTAILNLAVSIHIYRIVPEFALRFATWILARCLYRLRTHGHQHIPETGPAVLVCNHLSFVDWMVVAAGVKRPAHFVMYYQFAKIPVLRWFMRHAGVIPIAGKNEDPAIFARAFDQISEALRNGDLVCIFPEGGITKNGDLQEFKKGIEHILARDPVPVVPMGLMGLWGSMFSHEGKKAFTKLPRRFWHPVDLRIGMPVQAESAQAEVLEARVRELIR